MHSVRRLKALCHHAAALEGQLAFHKFCQSTASGMNDEAAPSARMNDAASRLTQPYCYLIFMFRVPPLSSHWR